MPKIGPVSWKVFVKILEADGWRQVRQQGSHVVLTKEGCPRPLVVPAHNPLTIGVIHSNLRTAQIDRDRYFALLEEHG